MRRLAPTAEWRLTDLSCPFSLREDRATRHTPSGGPLRRRGRGSARGSPAVKAAVADRSEHESAARPGTRGADAVGEARRRAASCGRPKLWLRWLLVMSGHQGGGHTSHQIELDKPDSRGRSDHLQGEPLASERPHCCRSTPPQVSNQLCLRSSLPARAGRAVQRSGDGASRPLDQTVPMHTTGNEVVRDGHEVRGLVFQHCTASQDRGGVAMHLWISGRSPVTRSGSQNPACCHRDQDDSMRCSRPGGRQSLLIAVVDRRCRL